MIAIYLTQTTYILSGTILLSESFPFIGKVLPHGSELCKLIRCEDTPKRQFIFETDTGNIGLRLLVFFKSCSKFALIYGVSVDNLVQ